MSRTRKPSATDDEVYLRVLSEEVEKLRLIAWPAQALRVIKEMHQTAIRYAAEAEPGGVLHGWTWKGAWEAVADALDELQDRLSDVVVARPAVVNHLADPFGGPRS